MTRWFDWGPDGHPTQWDFAIGLLAGVSAVVSLWNAASVRWPWFVAGFLTFGITVGPAQSTVVVARVGAWFRGIGIVGRTLAIVAFAVVAWTLVRLVPWIDAPLAAFGTGVLLVVAVVVGVEYLR